MLDWSIRLVRSLVAAVFLIAGILKLFDQATFARTIGAFGIVPNTLVPILAAVIPLLELVAGGALLWWHRGGLAMVTAMLMVYLAVVLYGLWRGLDIDCGCLGPAERLWSSGGSLRQTLMHDCVLLAACGYLWWSGTPRHDRFGRQNQQT